jgi:hypothetical protein
LSEGKRERERERKNDEVREKEEVETVHVAGREERETCLVFD